MKRLLAPLTPAREAAKKTTKRALHFMFGLAVDDDAPDIHKPYLTYALLITCLAVFLATQSDLETYTSEWGFSEYTKFNHGGLNLISSFFLHTGWLDLFGNLAYIFVFGERVERALGSFSFALLLIFSTLTGEFGHLFKSPSHLSIGANGGVAGLLTFYGLSFPRAKVIYQINIAVKLAFKNLKRKVIEFPAFIFLLLFFIAQIFGAMVQSTGLSTVDSWGHLAGLVGGFIFWYIWRI